MNKLQTKKQNVSKSIQDLTDQLKEEMTKRNVDKISPGYFFVTRNRNYEIVIACEHGAACFLFLLPCELELDKKVSVRLHWRGGSTPKRHKTSKITVSESKFFSNEFFNSLCEIINQPYSFTARKMFLSLR